MPGVEEIIKVAGIERVAAQIDPNPPAGEIDLDRRVVTFDAELIINPGQEQDEEEVAIDGWGKVDRVNAVPQGP